MSAITKRHEALQAMRMHAYWRKLHARKMWTAAADARKAGASYAHIARSLNMHPETVRKHIEGAITPDNQISTVLD